jgi:predicted NBD/HSP70 family sugar kinase
MRHSVPGAADQLSIRRSNLSLVLRQLRDHGPQPRRRIAEATGLNKATVSTLVSDLARRGLVAAGEAEPAGVGRPGIAIGLDGTAICGIGAEISIDSLAVMATSLGGTIITESRQPFDAAAAGPSIAFDELARLVTHAERNLTASNASVAGVTVALPGVLSRTTGWLQPAPGLRWPAVPATEMLTQRLGGRPVGADSDANLTALAELRFGVGVHSTDLLVLSGTSGVRAGLVAGGTLVRGARGHAGEVGHMPFEHDGIGCHCGRRGCWETVVGLPALLRAATETDDPVRDPSIDVDARLRELDRRAQANDGRTLAAFEQVGTALGVGAATLVNAFDPAVVVLGGYFAALGQWLVEPVQRQLEARVFGEAGQCTVEVSTLGFSAAVRGGAQASLDAIFDDPTRIPPLAATTSDAAGQVEARHGQR